MKISISKLEKGDQTTKLSDLTTRHDANQESIKEKQNISKNKL